MTSCQALRADSLFDHLDPAASLFSKQNASSDAILAAPCPPASTFASLALYHMAPPDPPASFSTQELGARAIASPSSVTPAERALTLDYPDPDTETSLRIAKTGFPITGVIAKALAVPPTLTAEEAYVLYYGLVDHTRAEKAARREVYHALTDEEGDLIGSCEEGCRPYRGSGRGKSKADSMAIDTMWKSSGTGASIKNCHTTFAAEQFKRDSFRASDNPSPPKAHRIALGTCGLDYPSPPEKLLVLGPPCAEKSIR